MSVRRRRSYRPLAWVLLSVACEALGAGGERLASPWTMVSERSTRDSSERRYQLDWAKLESILTEGEPSLLAIPAPDGRMIVFEIQSSQTLSPELQAKFPKIRTYRGTARDDRATSVRFETGPAGFRAEIREPRGRFFVEPEASGMLFRSFRRERSERRFDEPYGPNPTAPEGGTK